MSEKFKNFITEAIVDCEVELTAERQNVAEAKIQRRILQGDFLSTLI